MKPVLDLDPAWIIDLYGHEAALAMRRAARPDRQRAAKVGMKCGRPMIIPVNSCRPGGIEL